MLKSTDAGGYEDLALSYTNSDTRGVALGHVLWCEFSGKFSVLAFYLTSDVNPYCITLYHLGVCKRGGVCFGGWVAVIHPAFILTHGCRAFQKVCASRDSVGGVGQAEKSHGTLLHSATFPFCSSLWSL